MSLWSTTRIILTVVSYPGTELGHGPETTVSDGKRFFSLYSYSFGLSFSDSPQVWGVSVILTQKKKRAECTCGT